jgi:uncharacterized NAD(P)/FAD-binding protein YdhS
MHMGRRNKQRIAVVGGGSVGTSFIYQFINRATEAGLAEEFEILLFEPQTKVGQGYPYQEDSSSNVLNTRTDTTSVSSVDKAQFLTWLRDNYPGWQSDYPSVTLGDNEFLPRSLFGRYLQDVHAASLTLAHQRGIGFTVVHDAVLDIDRVGDGEFIVHTERSGNFQVSRVVLSIGNLPSDQLTELKDQARFFNDPYPTRKLVKAIDKRAAVGVVGTSLSAIDVVLSLTDAGHQGHVFCVSRSGLLPRVRSVFDKKYTLRATTKEKIDRIYKANSKLSLPDVLAVFTDELDLAVEGRFDFSAIVNRCADAVEFLEREIVEADVGPRIWQSVGYAFNDFIDYLWHLLDGDEKVRYKREFHRLWIYNRVSFPKASAEKLLKLLKSGRLSVLGGYMGAERAAGSYEVRLAPEPSDVTAEQRRLRCDYLINATGCSTDVTTAEVPLIKNLLRRGLGQPDVHGGFKLDYATGCLLERDGKINTHFTVLGSLSTGAYFWTNSVPINARLALLQVDSIVNAMLSRSPAGQRFREAS